MYFRLDSSHLLQRGRPRSYIEHTVQQQAYTNRAFSSEIYYDNVESILRRVLYRVHRMGWHGEGVLPRHMKQSVISPRCEGRRSGVRDSGRGYGLSCGRISD